MKEKVFQEQYKKLNPEQKEAVDTVEGPVMVVAGPGTGKTQVLTLRVANILLKSQVNPGNILALTFTENGAGEIRRRLADIIGAPAYQVNISTFHSFANKLIEEHPEEFGDILGRRSANEVEQIELLEDTISNSRLKLLRPFGEPFFYLPAVRQAIAHLKKEGITPSNLADILKKQEKEFEAIDDLYYDSGRYKGKMKGKYADFKKQLDKNTEVAVIYKSYQEQLAGKKIYDFDDMILELLKSLENNSDFLLRLQEKYQYFLVDEHQDTNNVQNKILELLSNFFDVPNLFVVGDERQAIFRFQGASLANFLYFKQLYPQAKLITLQKNYRSTQPILDAAQSFIQNNQHKLSLVLANVKDDLISVYADHPPSPPDPWKPVPSVSPSLLENPKSDGSPSATGSEGGWSASTKEKIQVYAFQKPEAEYYFLASQIKQLISQGVAPAEIALIYRDNKDARPVAEMLEKQQVPFRIESQRNVLDDPQIKNLILLLKFLNDPASEEKLFEVLHADFLNIPTLDVYKLFSQRRRGTVFASAVETKTLFTGVSRDIFSNFLRWQKLSKNTNLPEFFETVVRESGFLAYLLSQPDSAMRLNRLDGLFSEIKNLVQNKKNFSLVDLINYFDTLEKHGVSIKEKTLPGQSGAVRLMTAHGAKGLEFDHVFITNLFDGHWGNRRIPQLIKLPALFDFNSLSEKIDDERRLFYVAVTRARKMAYLSYAITGYDKRELLPSQFVGEIKDELKEAGPAGEYEKQLEKDSAVIYQPRNVTKFSVLDKEYLNALFFKRGLSATAVNSYLSCPWKYFYSSLLKIPKAKNKHQMYGTAVHAGLKDFFDYLKREEAVSKEILLARFEEALKKEPLTEKDLAESVAKGRDSLGAYFDYYQNTWRTETINEFRVHNVFFKLSEGDVKLTGSLDKIELMDFDHPPSPPDPWKPVPSVSPSLLKSPKSDGSPSATGSEGGWSPSNSYLVNVVDYKTGRSKTRNELEGKTQSSTGDYKRQLVFYKLLLDEHPTAKLKMVSGEIDFVEPDQKGSFQKEKFLISDNEVKELKETITDISDQILNLKFQDKTCGDRECEFCALKEKIAHVSRTKSP